VSTSAGDKSSASLSHAQCTSRLLLFFFNFYYFYFYFFIIITRYQTQRDVFIMDDCLSAVDPEVAQHIYQHCFKGLLGENGKTIVLVTHATWLLPTVDQIVLLGADKATLGVGGFDELIDRGLGPKLSSDVMEGLASPTDMDGGEDATTVTGGGDGVGLLSGVGEESTGSGAKKSNPSTASKTKGSDGVPTAAGAGQVLIEKEEMAEGAVTLKVYKTYMDLGGGWTALLTILCTLSLYSAFDVSGNIVLALWTDEVVPQSTGILLYGIVNASVALCIVTAVYISFMIGLKAAVVAHKGMLDVVMRSPTSFFDTTPIGRILNRFASDMESLDRKLMQSVLEYLMSAMYTVASLLVIMAILPLFVPAILPLMVLYRYITTFFLRTSRGLKRLDSVTKSPIYSHFGESLAGLSTIRAFGEQARFQEESCQRVETNLRAFATYQVANRWLGVRLGILGVLVVAVASVVCVTGRGTIDPGFAGLCITYSLQIVGVLGWLVRMSAEMENNIVAVERIEEYSNIPPEAPLHIRPAVKGVGTRLRRDTLGVTASKEEWPTAGGIVFTNVSMRYRETLPRILNSLSITILPSEKVGVVGRTGAGKSSMMLVLMRIVELEGGSIHLDGVDISSIGLHDLRSKISIIPQDPVMFTGTIRFNLDPFNKYTDHEVQESLKKVALLEFVQSMENGVDSVVEENGQNLSLGQRQLLCLSRMLLRQNKILLLDEATSAVGERVGLSATVYSVECACACVCASYFAGCGGHRSVMALKSILCSFPFLFFF
jgi:ABC-type multidrug transport system fused ATPase/permease subunit